MLLGLKRGTVILEPHDKQWDEIAAIDIVVGVTDIDRIMTYNEQLQQEGIFYRGSDVGHQLLYVMSKGISKGAFCVFTGRINDFNPRRRHILLYKKRHLRNEFTLFAMLWRSL